MDNLKNFVDEFKETIQFIDANIEYLNINDNKNQIILLLSFSEGKILISLFKRLEETLKIKRNIIIGASSIKSDIFHINQTLHEAFTAIENRRIGDSCYLYYYSDLQIRDQIYYLPSDFQKTVMNYIVAGDSIQVLNYLSKIYDRNKKKNISFLCYIQFNAELITILNRILTELNIEKQKIPNYDINNIFEESASIDEYEKRVKNVYCAVSEYFEENNNNNDKSVHEYMIKFINENYNKDIYLETIAENLGLTANYISRCFKKNKGITYMEYINKLRINKAKELLIKTNKKVNEIYKEVGYQSQNSFMRMFKKIEGISPLEYRKLNKHKVNLNKDE